MDACINPEASNKLAEILDGIVEADFLENYLEEIAQCYEALNGNSKIIIIKGIHGTGKSSLMEVLTSSLKETVYSFYFNCSEITTLDDIFFSLYMNLAKSDFKKDLETQGAVKNQSIDERIINFLKKVKTPYCFMLNSFENMLNEDGEIESEEFQNFISYLTSIPTVKIIVSGRTIFEKIFKIPTDEICTIRTKSLDESQCQKLLKKLNLEVSTHLNFEIYKATKGYPFNIMLFAKTVNKIRISPFDILKDFSSQKLVIEEFLVKKLYGTLPSSAKRLLWYLCCIRNSLKLNSLEKLAPVENLKELIAILQDNLLIVNAKNNIYAKFFIKNAIYQLIPNNEKISIHKFYSNCYNENIALKPTDRILRLSRNSMHAEKYYHYNAAMRLEKSYQSLKPGTTTGVESPPILPPSEKIKILSSLSLNADYSDKFSKPSSIQKNSTQNKSIILNNTPAIALEIDEANLNLQLSEEEKELIKDLPTQDSVGISNDDEIDEVVQNKSEIEELVGFVERSELKNDYSIAIDYCNQALNIVETENNINGKAFLLHKQGVNFHKLGNFEEAYSSLMKAKQIYIESNDFNNINLVNLSIGKAYSDNFKYNEAAECFNNILKSSNHPSSSILTEALIELADIHEYKQEINKAVDFYHRGLQNSIEMNNKPNLCRIYFKLGLIYDDIADIEKALENYQKCIKASNDVEINKYLAASYSNIAAIFEEEKNIDEAISYYQKSFEVDAQIANFHGQYKTLSSLGNLYFDQKDEKQALAYFHKEIDAAKLTKDPYYIASSYLEIGDVYLNLNNYENALKAYLIARKNIEHTISTDSKEKIERRFHEVLERTGEVKYREILDKLRKK
jgi:tetratricopeptide (TPR) repeat protein